MRTAYWQAVRAAGCTVPTEGGLADLTAELTAELGNADPDARELALDVLLTWVRGGVYDGLLGTLGDGMAAGLDVGLGHGGDTTVFRRVSSARLLAACVARDTAVPEVGRDHVLVWGDRLLAWLTRERDLRGHPPGQGEARAIAHGADAVGVLAGSPAVGEAGLVALLDVVADRLAAPASSPLVERDEDHLARAVMAILRRDLVDPAVIEAWLGRIGDLATESSPGSATPGTANAQRLLRALHLQLTLGADPPSARGDLVLAVVEVLRRSNRWYLRG